MSGHIIQASKDQLIEEFNTLVSETEQLLHFVAKTGGEKTDALCASIEQNLAIARKRLRYFQQAATEKTRDVAVSTDAYVHEHPWQAIGMTAGLVVIIGAVASLLLNRHCSSDQ